jgi:hypothetical protein
MATERAHPRAARRLLEGLKDIEQVFVNGDLTRRVPHNLNISFNFVEGESLIMGIKGWRCRRARPAPRPAWSPATCCAPWAAATSWRTAPAHDHRPLHDRRRDRLRHRHAEDRVAKLRELSPLWDMYRTASISTIQWARTERAPEDQELQHGIQRQGHRPLRNPATSALRQGRRHGGHRHGRRAGLRRRDEAADQGQPGHRRDRGCRFKTYGCGSAIASSSLVTEWVKGKTLDQALEIKNTQIAEAGAAAGEDPLLHPGRRRHQGGGGRLPRQATSAEKVD